MEKPTKGALMLLMEKPAKGALMLLMGKPAKGAWTVRATWITLWVFVLVRTMLSSHVLQKKIQWLKSGKMVWVFSCFKNLRVKKL